MSVPETSRLLYCDDVKYFHDCSSAMASASFQFDLNRLSTWAAFTGMVFNILKCCLLFIGKEQLQKAYYLQGQQIPVVDSARDLGTWINHRADFSTHLAHALCVGYGLANLIKQNFRCRSRELWSMLYTVYLLPSIMFGAAEWYQPSASNDAKLMRLYRFYWRMCPAGPPPSILNPLEEIRKLSFLLIHRVASNRTSLNAADFMPNIAHLHRTRSAVQRRTFIERSDSRPLRCSLFHRLREDWNSLPEQVRSLPKKAFRDHIVQKIISERGR